MKAFYSLTVFIAMLVVCMAAFTPEQRREFETKLVADCKGPTQATDADAKGLLDYEAPTTRTGKCLLACTQEKLGIIVDGKISIDGLKAVGVKKHAGDDKAIATFNEIVSECENSTGADNCELGFNLMQCMMKGAEKRGINPKD